MPMRSKIEQSMGMMRTLASTLGAIRYCMGLTAIVSSASICSVMRMMPISAVMAEPARPVAFRAELPQRVVPLQPQHHPGKGARQHDHEEGFHPDEVDLLQHLQEPEWGPHHPGHRADQEDHHAAHLADEPQGGPTEAGDGRGDHQCAPIVRVASASGGGSCDSSTRTNAQKNFLRLSEAWSAWCFIS